MSGWTHPICDDCWDDRNPERLASRVQQGDIEHCCFCGRHTTSGIYIREEPDAIEDHVPHHPARDR